jgi:predicted Zn-dependent protease
MVVSDIRSALRKRFYLSIALGSLVMFGCSIQPKLPGVVDHPVESVVRREAAAILAVSEDRESVASYHFFLSDFPRQDTLGMSVGDRRIYISYKLASSALYDAHQLWLLRQTIAHEIAHETAAHARREGDRWFNRVPFAWGASGREVGLPWYVRVHNYATDKELEADRIGLSYWKKLGWDCRIWVGILENFERQGYRGDSSHPTSERLRQARSQCDDAPQLRFSQSP